MNPRQLFLSLRADFVGAVSRSLRALHIASGDWASRADKAHNRAVCDEVNAARACRVITR